MRSVSYQVVLSLVVPGKCSVKLFKKSYGSRIILFSERASPLIYQADRVA
jgi:hypothetical protein